MAADAHLLVTGGPGSGKTTAAILKGADIAGHELRPGQSVLFLSFARATVSRVIEAIQYEQHIPRELRRRIEVDTTMRSFGASSRPMAIWSVYPGGSTS